MIRPFLCALLLALLVPVQDPVAPEREAVAQRIGALESASTPEAQAELLLYREAAAALERVDAAQRQRQEELARTQEVPGLLESLRLELAQKPEELVLEDAGVLDLEARAERLTLAQAALGAAQAERDELESRRKTRLARSSEIPEVVARKQKELAALKEAWVSLPANGAGDEARRASLGAQSEALRAELEALAAEQASLERRREVLPLRQERAQRELQRAEKVAQHWQDKVNEARQQEAEQATLEAQRKKQETLRQFPALVSMAERNQELAALRTGEDGLPQRIARAQQELAAVRELQAEVDRRHAAFERRLSLSVLGEGLGTALRADYEWLPGKADLREAELDQEERYAEAFLFELRTEEELVDQARLERDRDELFRKLGVVQPSPELQAVATELHSARRKLLEEVGKESEVLLGGLEQLRAAQRQLAATVRQFRLSIEERILWVRSIEVGFFSSLALLPADALKAIDPATWGPGVDAIYEAGLDEAGQVLLVGVVVLAVLALRRRLLRRRARLADLVRSYRTDRLRYSFAALGLCLLQAAPLPLAAWQLSELGNATTDEVALGLGFALRRLIGPLLLLELLRQVLRERGFGESHLRWPSSSSALVRREVKWFAPLALASGFVFLVFHRQGIGEFTETLGRLGFLVLVTTLGVFLARLLRRDGPIPRRVGRGVGLLVRTRRVWATVAIGLPVLFFVLAVGGYYYTAVELFNRLVLTLGFAAGLALVNALLLRWLFITRRRLAVEQARERTRAQRAAAAAATSGADGSAESAQAALDEEAVDIPSLDAQTRQLFRSGITLAAVLGVYFIWASVLPALQGLDRVQIYPSFALLEAEPEAEPEAGAPEWDLQQPAPETDPAAGQTAPLTSPAQRIAAESTAADGEATPEPDPLGLPSTLTLADLSLALIFTLLTWIAARNLPGLLEISLLQRLPVDAGARYAITTLLRYLIVIVGLSVVSSTLGLGWKNVQWLVAALTFGLAFGLQEIFANFVSGLIILVERPVRVGDIVTVSGIEGRVTRLRMRATTIQDWDRREFLIPNKELIIGSVINWTLSDPVTRIVIPVGIAYGSDTALARRLLEDVARRCTAVLDDPKARAIFRGFGDSTLNFELRVFIANRDLWPDVVDQVNAMIDDAFRKAGVEIAFPQRDLHLRSVPDGFMQGAAGGAAVD